MTTAQLDANTALKASFAKTPVVIIGNGPVGVKAAQLILEQSDYHHVAIYGEEQYKPYNRVQLSLFLSGKLDRQQLANPVSLKKSSRLTEYIGKRIVDIDFKTRQVIDQDGNTQRYSKLIFATGSSAFIPDLKGVNKKDVYTFRSIDDANKLIECREQKKSIFIIGCGALGLETALAMKTPSNKVMVGVREKLLSRQLDASANTILRDRIQSSGIELIFKDPIIEINGSEKAERVVLQSGRNIAIDTVVICAGIRPNVTLAKKLNLKLNKGILVDDHMLTDEENIYAIGECAEHNGATYGIVAPGFEQAENCVNHILGVYSKYRGSVNNLQLKIQQHHTNIYGDVESEPDKVYTYTHRLQGVFRKIMVKDNRMVGYIAIGDWNEQVQIKEFIQEKRRVPAKRFKLFEQRGLVWDKSEVKSLKEQPEEYIVCLCKSVTRGELTKSMDAGNRTIDSLCDNTGAGLTCGSCKPLVAQMLDTPLANLVMRHHNSIFAASIISLLMIALLLLNQPIASSISVQVDWKVEMLWFDNFWKQVSGYTLLGLCILGGMLSVRKRVKAMNIGNLDNWRLYHSIIGVIALLILVIHTGFRLGNNLNFALMVVFLAATTTGSLVGIFMSKSHHWTDLKLRSHRKWWSRIHYTLLWLLPALLAYHIFVVYYF
jgi:nitrite reductase (NADH) large subunit